MSNAMVKVLSCCIVPGLLCLVGCGVQMQVEVCAPSAVGAAVSSPGSISIVKECPGRAAAGLQQAFKNSLQSRGYSIAPARKAAGQMLLIRDVDIRCVHAGKHAPIFTDPDKQRAYYERHFNRVHNSPSHLELSATVELVARGKTLFSKRHRINTVNSLRMRPDLADACNIFVTAVLKEMLSQRKGCNSLKIEADSSIPQLKSAVRACRAGQWMQALRVAREAHALHPSHPEPIYLIGIIAWQQGDAGAAIVLFRRAYALKADERYRRAENLCAAAR